MNKETGGDQNKIMKILKPLFDFYINSSIHVALAVVSLCVVSYVNFDFSPDTDLLLFVFFGSITGYNFVKYAGIAKLQHSSLANGLKIIQVFSFFAFLFLLWGAWNIQIDLLYWTAFFGVFTLLYALPVLSKKRNLRSISGIKIFVIAFVWAGVTVILPFIEGGGTLSLQVLPEFVQRFLLVLVLILPFEIRDLKYDLQQLGTIPQKMGVTRTKILGFVMLSGLFLIEFFKESVSTSSISALAMMVLFTAGMIWKSRERQSQYFSAFWVESIPILWMMILLLFKSF